MSQREQDLGPKPEAQIEPGEPDPGGVDAAPGSDGVDTEVADETPIVRDLDPDDNTAVEDALPDPDAVKQTDDTDTDTDGNDDVSPDEESPA